MYGLSDEDDGLPPVPSIPPPIGSKSSPAPRGRVRQRHDASNAKPDLLQNRI